MRRFSALVPLAAVAGAIALPGAPPVEDRVELASVSAAVERASRTRCHRRKGAVELDGAKDRRRGRAIPEDTIPPERPELWPRSIGVPGLPILVHYRGEDEATMARTVADLMRPAWRLNVETLGFRAPPDDGGAVGPDGRFDVYLWRGLDECWVDVYRDIEATAWDDVTCFMAIDPWGSYGGDALGSTVAHELNHACQAADDWYDAPAVYEMTATWVEQQTTARSNGEVTRLAEPLADFQAHPDWGLDHDDEYDSWYMYGSALFLDFLQQRRFGGERRFAADLWKACRSPQGAEEEPSRNEPDALDAFDQVLRARGSTLDDALLEFARWRWRIGREGPGGIVTRLAPVAPAEPAPPPESARVASARGAWKAGTQVRFGGPRAGRAGTRVDGGAGPMRLGSRYVTLRRGQDDPARLRVTSKLAPGVRWVLQSIPGPRGEAEGARVPLVNGAATLECAAGGELTLVLTALPEAGYDADARDERRFAATLVLGAAP